MKARGFNVYAVEVEAALAEHPAVLMSALPKPVKGTILAPKPRESGECRLSSSFDLSRANSTYILATNVWTRNITFAEETSMICRLMIAACGSCFPHTYRWPLLPGKAGDWGIYFKPERSRKSRAARDAVALTG